jgi:hypothetical protein
MPRTAKGDGIDVGEADIELALSSELGDRMISAIETAALLLHPSIPDLQRHPGVEPDMLSALASAPLPVPTCRFAFFEQHGQTRRSRVAQLRAVRSNVLHSSCTARIGPILPRSINAK